MPAGRERGADCDPIQPEWTGQEAAAFPDSWSVGMSFYHNLFAREHNTIVDEFRKMATRAPGRGFRASQSGDARTRRSPTARSRDDELFEIARLIVAAEIAKIHTIEWTPQLLYDEPLNIGMNSNWSGLFEDGFAGEPHHEARRGRSSADRTTARKRNQLYSAFAAGAGIVGRGSSRAVPRVPSEMARSSIAGA